MAFVFRGMDFPTLGRALAKADPLCLAGVVLAALITYLLRAWRWGYLLAPMARVPLGELFSATCIGFMTGLVVPRAGEIVRPYLVARRHPVSISAGFATIILERLFDLLTVLILFALYLFALPVPTGLRFVIALPILIVMLAKIAIDLSFQKIGTSTMQSRATAGVANATYIFALPGSTGACRDGWDRILHQALDSRYRPCSLAGQVPRLRDQIA